MKDKKNWQLLLGIDTDPVSWVDRFRPFSFVWENTDPVFEGSLFYPEDNPIATVRYYPEEKRLEFYPNASQEDAVSSLFQHTSFLQLFENPVTSSLMSMLEKVAQTNELQEKLSLIRSLCYTTKLVLPFVDKPVKKQLSKQLRLLDKREKRLSTELELPSFFAKYGLEAYYDVKKQDKQKKKFEKAFSCVDWNGWLLLALESALVLGQFNVGKSYESNMKALVKAVHKVHSARDIKALRKVRKLVKRRAVIAVMASEALDKNMISLNETLDTWHYLIMLQDRLLSIDHPPMYVLHALVRVQQEIEVMLETYRSLTAQLWEEGR